MKLLAETSDDASNKHQSDTTSSGTHVEESIDSRKETFKKEKSVKNILDKLLPSSGQTNPIQVIESFNNVQIFGKLTGILGGFSSRRALRFVYRCVRFHSSIRK